ncbi:MAG: glycosyltransferase family 4 protein [Pseudomonadota bacterium]
MQKVVNVAEIAEPDWNFVESQYTGPAVDWRYFAANPRNALERSVRRPKLGRYRACWQATRALSAPDDVVISHLPRTTHWQSHFMRAMGRDQRHMAFAFNFTDLPEGRSRASMSRTFQRVDRFVVCTDFERQLYADHFQLPIERFELLHWAIDTPEIDPSFAVPWPRYYSSAGGEARDFKTLLQAFEKLPHLKLVIVTRPQALAGLRIPPNVHVFHNLPHAQFWTVVGRSEALIVPLRDSQTPCGNISLVGAMTLSRPLVSTLTEGTRDYAHHERNALVTAPGDVAAMTQAIARLEEEPALRQRLGAEGKAFAQEHCDPRRWAEYIQAYVTRRPSAAPQKTQ